MPKKIKLEDCKTLADLKGGSLLSEKYINAHKKMIWKCSCDHIFEAKYNSVQQGHWCPFCSKNIKSNIDQAKKIAQLRGGVCLSSVYINARNLLKWKCSLEHIWYASLDNVKNKNKWCKICGFEKAKITNIKKYGVDNVFKSPIFIARIKKTLLLKYGVDVPCKNKEIALKVARSSNNSFILYHWKTNKEVICIGSYEKRVVEYFNRYKINYDWQPKVFNIPNTKTYTPDCYLPDRDLWVEIKGYMRDDALEKWNWFHTEYPNSELWNERVLKKMGVL